MIKILMHRRAVDLDMVPSNKAPPLGGKTVLRCAFRKVSQRPKMHSRGDASATMTSSLLRFVSWVVWGPHRRLWPYTRTARMTVTWSLLRSLRYRSSSPTETCEAVRYPLSVLGYEYLFRSSISPAVNISSVVSDITCKWKGLQIIRKSGAS